MIKEKNGILNQMGKQCNRMLNTGQKKICNICGGTKTQTNNGKN